MATKLKKGSIAFEAARLTIELGTVVTVDQVRWWRKKRYPMDDIPALRKCLRNQERPPKLGPEIPVDMTLAYEYITDAVIKSAKGTVPIADLLDYLRDQWETDEWSAARWMDKTAEERVAIAQRSVKANLLSLRELIGIDIVEKHREKLCDELWPQFAGDDDDVD